MDISNILDWSLKFLMALPGLIILGGYLPGLKGRLNADRVKRLYIAVFKTLVTSPLSALWRTMPVSRRKYVAHEDRIIALERAVASVDSRTAAYIYLVDKHMKVLNLLWDIEETGEGRSPYWSFMVKDLRGSHLYGAHNGATGGGLMHFYTARPSNEVFYHIQCLQSKLYNEAASVSPGHEIFRALENLKEAIGLWERLFRESVCTINQDSRFIATSSDAELRDKYGLHD